MARTPTGLPHPATPVVPWRNAATCQLGIYETSARDTSGICRLGEKSVHRVGAQKRPAGCRFRKAEREGPFRASGGTDARGEKVYTRLVNGLWDTCAADLAFRTTSMYNSNAPPLVKTARMA